MASQQPSTWSTGLCACCDDMGTCCYAFWCFPCFTCTTSADFGEDFCLPLCDICIDGIPPATLAIRVAVRHKYGIQGTLCNDILASCFCKSCVWCQVAREIKHRKKGPTTVVSAQPTPMVVVQNQVLNQAPPSVAPPSVAPPSVAPPYMAPPSMAPPPAYVS